MPVYALRESFHPSGQSLRIVIHPEQSVRLRCQVHACDRGDGIRLPVVRVEIAFHVLRKGVIVGICQHDLTVQVDRGGNPVIFHTPSRNRIA